MSIIKKAIKVFKKSKITDWLEKIFKYQFGKIISIIYKDATVAVTTTQAICNYIETAEAVAIDDIVKTYGIELSQNQISQIKNKDYRIRFYIAKQILINQLKKDKKEYKEYIIDTIIQLAYVYIKEKAE